MAVAEAAVSFVLSKLGDIALNKALELYQVSDQVEPMQLELRMIQSFLKDADSKANHNPRVKQWVKEVRDVAHKIEDAVDTFLVEIEENPVKNPSKSSGIISKLKRLGKHPKKVNRFCDEIKNIQATLKRIDEVRIRLGITDIGGGSEERSAAVVPHRPSKLHEIDVSEVVGFDADKNAIVGHLLNGSISRRTVLSIVGIGGLGKTTLAKKVHESAEVKAQFDYRIWLSISHKFNLTNLLREILYKIDPQMKITGPTMTDEDLSMELEKSLSEKRYLITLDDVWITDLWNQLKIILPDTKNGSRVLITSRSLEVAKAADPGTSPHKLSCLTEEESITLLLRKALPHKQPDSYPNIMAAANQLAKNCGGLPLALTVLGGILSTRDPTYSVWHMMEQTMDWHNEKEKKCSQVLATSYNDLPYHLKPCFLYFASFPEDYKISAKHITRMWIAEGFITKDGVGTLEDKAHNYLQELAQRCLVQVIKKSWNGYCKYCRIHDLLRDLAIHEAKEENFFTVFSKAEDGSQLDARVARRAAIQVSIRTEYGIHSSNTRSLLFFGQSISNYGEFRLLRVLTIEGVDMDGKEVAYGRWLKGLIHLRYLGFRYCEELPRGFGHVSFSSLKNLETLDFKGTEIEEKLDDSLWEVPTLRHVNFPLESELTCNSSKWDRLKNIETLKWMTLQKFPELGCNINLRKVGLSFDDDFWRQYGSVEQAQHMLKGLLKRMEFLTSLSVCCAGYVVFPIGDTSDLPYYGKIQNFYLKGMWPKGIIPNVEMFPTNLIKLTLEDSRLERDPMPVLEKLQCLRILLLGDHSYVGTELICSMGGFPSLQKLVVWDLQNVHYWGIEKGAMRILSQLKISCINLRALPELQNVPTLQHLTLSRKTRPEEQYKIKHIPSVHISRKNGWDYLFFG